MNPGMRIYEQLSGLEGVSAGGTATLRVPTNRRHLMLRVFAIATIGGVVTTDATAIIEEVTTMIGARVIRQERAIDIAQQRLFNKLPADASGALTLYYAEPNRSDVLDEVVTAFECFGDVTNFVLKFKLKAGISAATITVVDVYDNSVLTDAKNNKIRQIIKRSPIAFNLGTVGDITSLPVDLPILGIFLIGETGKTIDAVKATVDDTQVVHDMTNAQNKAFLADYNRDGSAFSYCLRFDMEGQISRRLEGIRNLTLRVASSAPQSITALVEYVAPDYI